MTTEIKNNFILFLGITFLIVGIILAFKGHWKDIRTYLPIAVGMILLYLVITGPLSDSKNQITFIQNLEGKKIREIVFKPIHVNQYGDLKTFKFLRITRDRQQISRICFKIKESTPISENYIKYLNDASRVLIKFVFKDDSKLFVELLKRNERTVLEINSKGTSGWRAGSLVAKDLGFYLETLK